MKLFAVALVLMSLQAQASSTCLEQVKQELITMTAEENSSLRSLEVIDHDSALAFIGSPEVTEEEALRVKIYYYPFGFEIYLLTYVAPISATVQELVYVSSKDCKIQDRLQVYAE